MHTSVRVPMYSLVTVYTSRGSRLESCALHIVFGEGSPTEHDTCLPLQAKLAGGKPQECFCLYLPQSRDHSHMPLCPAFICESRGSKLRPLCLYNKHFLTKPFPQHHGWYSFCGTDYWSCFHFVPIAYVAELKRLGVASACLG